MSEQNFRLGTDAGILTIVWDMPGRSMNVLTEAAIGELAAILDKVIADEAILGVIVISGKETFSGGADLSQIGGLGRTYDAEAKGNPEQAAARLFEDSRKLSQLYRRIETCGKPWVAAIHGTCLGGAFELALACHARIVSDDPATRLGLPEIKVGIFPGAGGTQRVARMMPAADALQFMLKGDPVDGGKAKTMGLADAVVARAELPAAARKWIEDGGSAVKPWDADGFKLPGGPVWSKSGFMTWPPANALYRRETHDNYPAARAILKVVFDGLQLPMDRALTVESRHFARILRTTEAKAMIRSLFVSMQDLNKGARRPKAVPAAPLKKIGVIGAGFMGAGIAYVSARAGLEVVLIDRDQAAADKGREHSRMLMEAQVKKGRATEEQARDLLARIVPTTDYTALTGCDLVIEAVFEDPKVKAGVIGRMAAAGPDCILSSNTSTLPISGLAQHAAQPENFIGIHFFSPVDKMMLVEIIRGENTGDAALARALDFVKAIKKTPIVVNDARGFYANRCVGAYVLEGHLMLLEGVPPAMIENVARMAGMPVGPLALNDEVALDLALKILRTTEREMGEGVIDPRQLALLARMVEQEGRLGRKNGMGFYDYPDGGKKKLWPGLAELTEARLDPDSIDIEELKHRFLAAQALEAVRTFKDSIVTDVREADVGAIIGFGFPPFTGGPLSWIDGMGTEAFLALAEALEAKHGRRFHPPRLLHEMAERGETFYGRFSPEASAA